MVAPLLDARCRRRLRAPLPRRSASAQHLPDRRQADAVRRHRIRRGAGQHRRALRPGVPADGSRLSPARRGSPLSPSTAIWRRPRTGGLAALPLFLSSRAAIRAHVRRDGRDAGADKRGALARRRAAISTWRSASSTRPAAPGRGRRPVGHRQDNAGARPGARGRAVARRRRAAQRRHPQGAGRRRPADPARTRGL